MSVTEIIILIVVGIAVLIATIFTWRYSVGFKLGRGPHYARIIEECNKIKEPKLRDKVYRGMRNEIYAVVWCSALLVFPISLYTLIKYKGDVIGNE